jgi:hypothetical protein
MRDEVTCDIMDFPTTEWSVYDRYRDDFVGIPTLSCLIVSQGDILIFRPSSFKDPDCVGLNDLIGREDSKGKRKRTHSPYLDCTVNQKKRKCEADAEQVIESVVLDWTNL